MPDPRMLQALDQALMQRGGHTAPDLGPMDVSIPDMQFRRRRPMASMPDPSLIFARLNARRAGQGMADVARPLAEDPEGFRAMLMEQSRIR